MPLSSEADRLAPEDLFLFVGAGASWSMPSGRPMFRSVRDEILRQLRLESYIPAETPPLTDDQEVVAGLAPEPFVFALMEGLKEGKTEVQRWFGEILGDGAPNAAHCALGSARK